MWGNCVLGYSAYRGQKMALELELQATVNHHMGARNGTKSCVHCLCEPAVKSVFKAGLLYSRPASNFLCSQG